VDLRRDQLHQQEDDGDRRHGDHLGRASRPPPDRAQEEPEHHGDPDDERQLDHGARGVHARSGENPENRPGDRHRDRSRGDEERGGDCWVPAGQAGHSQRGDLGRGDTEGQHPVAKLGIGHEVAGQPGRQHGEGGPQDEDGGQPQEAAAQPLDDAGLDRERTDQH